MASAAVRQSGVSAILLFGFLLLSAGVSPAFAQRPTGVIAGTVTDATGTALVGATVVLNSPSLITPDLTTTTDRRGWFRVPHLEPGVYSVRVRQPGFADVLRPAVQLVVGQTVGLTFELQAAGAETVVVTAETPVVDLVRTASSYVYTRDVLESIPNTRFFGDVFNYAPGVLNDSTRGSSVRGNAYRLDGVDVTDPVVGAPFAFFNYDIFEEVQVQTGGHPAEYGQATGAVANLVTRSGGNQLSGRASLYVGDDALNATNGQRITDRFPELTPGRALRLTNPQVQLGGPIVNDRVWFFGAYEHVRSDVTQPGFNDRQGEPIPRERAWDYVYGKVTSQLDTAHRVVAGINNNGFRDDNRGAGSLTPQESTRIEESGAWTANAEWSGLFGRALTQLRYTSVDQHLNLLPKNNLARCQNITTGIAGCSDGRVDLNERTRRQLHGAVALDGQLAGYHSVKVGGEYESSHSWRDLTFNQGRWLNVFEDANGGVTTGTVWTFQDPPTEESLTRTSLFVQDSWHVTDHMTLNLGLRVDRSEGWLPEQALPDGRMQPETRDVVARTEVAPRLGVAWDPFGTGTQVVRAGYSRYAGALITTYFLPANGNGLAGQLHAHCEGPLSRFCLPGDAELSTLLLSSFGPSSTLIDDGLVLPKTDEVAVGYEFELRPSMSVAINYVWKREFDLIEDAETARSFIGRTAYHPGDTEVDEAGTVVDRVGPQSFTVFDPDLQTPSQLVVSNPDEAERDYRGLELVVNKRFSDRWQVQTSFTVSESTGLVGTSFLGSSSVTSLFNDPNASINAGGALDLDRTYALKALGTYQLPYEVSVSAFYRGLSGLPYTRTVALGSYDSDGDGRNDTPLLGGAVTINAEPKGTRRLDSLHLVDLGLEKTLGFANTRLGLRLDVYNLFNIDTVLSKRTRTSAAGSFGEPLSFVDARGARLAARLSF